MTEIYDKEGKLLDTKKLRELLKEAEEAESRNNINETEQSTEVSKQIEKINEKKPFKLNIACGQQKMEGFIGIDKCKTDMTDVVHDLEIFPWPFEDNSIDEVYCSHYIEHTKDLVKFMEELYRIMKKPYINEKGEEIKSKCTVIAPYYSSVRAWQDPFHKRAISEFTFLYFNKNWRDQNKLNHGDYDIKADFDFTYGYQMSDPYWTTRSEDARVFAMKYYINVISDIQVVLTKR